MLLQHRSEHPTKAGKASKDRMQKEALSGVICWGKGRWARTATPGERASATAGKKSKHSGSPDPVRQVTGNVSFLEPCQRKGFRFEKCSVCDQWWENNYKAFKASYRTVRLPASKESGKGRLDPSFVNQKKRSPVPCQSLDSFKEKQLIKSQNFTSPKRSFSQDHVWERLLPFSLPLPEGFSHFPSPPTILNHGKGWFEILARFTPVIPAPRRLK
jgi:hypothetical protein